MVDKILEGFVGYANMLNTACTCTDAYDNILLHTCTLSQKQKYCMIIVFGNAFVSLAIICYFVRKI